MRWHAYSLLCLVQDQTCMRQACMHIDMCVIYSDITQYTRHAYSLLCLVQLLAVYVTVTRSGFPHFERCMKFMVVHSLCLTDNRSLNDTISPACIMTQPIMTADWSGIERNVNLSYNDVTRYEALFGYICNLKARSRAWNSLKFVQTHCYLEAKGS